MAKSTTRVYLVAEKRADSEANPVRRRLVRRPSQHPDSREGIARNRRRQHPHGPRPAGSQIAATEVTDGVHHGAVQVNDGGVQARGGHGKKHGHV